MPFAFLKHRVAEGPGKDLALPLPGWAQQVALTSS